MSGVQSIFLFGCSGPHGSDSWREAEQRSIENVPDRSALAPTDPVSVQRCPTYEPQEVYQALQHAFFDIGGIEELVAGRTVTVKMNITGSGNRPMVGRPPERTYQVHPVVVEAVCSLFARAGARRIVLVESFAEDGTPEEILSRKGWDIGRLLSAGEQRVLIEDTRNRGEFNDYGILSVPYGGYVFDRYHLNRRYLDTDVLVSLAKLKNHAVAGVTCAAKNLFGITPSALYGNDAPNEGSNANRTGVLHYGTRQVPSGVTEERYPTGGEVQDEELSVVSGSRVPRVTADLASLRPVELSVVDGVEAVAGGEGPWNTGVRLASTRPGIIVAGTNPVTTDAVCTAIMGYDPGAPAGVHPFPGENHLNLLARAGAGSNDLGSIEVRGLGLSEALYPYSPGHPNGNWTARYLDGEV